MRSLRKISGRISANTASSFTAPRFCQFRWSSPAALRPVAFACVARVNRQQSGREYWNEQPLKAKSPSSPVPRAASAPRSPSVWRATALPSSSTTPRAPGRPRKLVRRIVESGGRASAFKADVSDPAAVRRDVRDGRQAVRRHRRAGQQCRHPDAVDHRRHQRQRFRQTDRDQSEGHVQRACARRQSGFATAAASSIFRRVSSDR